MTTSLEHKLREYRNPSEMLRNSPMSPYVHPVPSEFSSWRDEQEGWANTAVLFDQPYHMTDLYVKGPDMVRLLSDLEVNTFKGFKRDKAKQLIVCNYDRYVIGDAVLFALEGDGSAAHRKLGAALAAPSPLPCRTVGGPAPSGSPMYSAVRPLERLLAEREITRLVMQYALLNDESDWAAVAATFTEDGRLVRPSGGDTVFGREAIRTSYESRPPRTSRHLITSIFVDVLSADEAACRSAMLLYTAPVGEMAASSPALIGGFRDRLVRVAEGWRFSERIGFLDLRIEIP
jgi:hypothetical protein